MSEHLLEIKIVQPGRIHGQYYTATPDILRLEKIVFPAETMPFDAGILSGALTLFGKPVAVLVLDELSQPVSAEIENRLFSTSWYQYELAHGFYDKKMDNAIFFRAERRPDGGRTYKLIEGEPLETSYGIDAYDKIFGERV